MRAHLVSKIRAATEIKFDAVIEAVGKPEIWEAAVQLVRKGGAVNFFGGCSSGTKVSFDTERIHYSNLTLLASFHHTPGTVRRALLSTAARRVRSSMTTTDCSRRRSRPAAYTVGASSGIGSNRR